MGNTKLASDISLAPGTHSSRIPHQARIDGARSRRSQGRRRPAMILGESEIHLPLSTRNNIRYPLTKLSNKIYQAKQPHHLTIPST
jgi:hypothetical protein